MNESKSLTPLLQSKVNPPIINRSLVPRTGLIEQLKSAKNARLVLLRVPAGFGKTTFLVQWIAQIRAEGAYTSWLTLDEADNDPGRFFRYFIASLKKSIAELDLEYSEYEPDGTLLYILQQLSGLKAPLTIVLDDFGVIRSPEVLRTIQSFLNHLPPLVRLVIAIRQVPELGLERLRAQGEIVEILIDDLQFTLDETRLFIREAQGLDLDEKDIEFLHRFTEGWAAGLQLSTLTNIWKKDRKREDQVRSWDLGKIYDYLAEEVLARQPENIQQFLLKTSILEKLSGPLCDRLTGTTESRKVLDCLERANIFVSPLDPERRWYRYHSLFSKFLRNRLERTDPEIFAPLHRAALEWFLEKGDVVEAAEHARSAGDFERAASLMDESAFDLVKSGLHATIINWGNSLPDKVIGKHPFLQIVYAYSSLVRNDFDKALDILDRLEISLSQEKIKSPNFYDMLIIRSLVYMCQDDIQKFEQATLRAMQEVSALKSTKNIRFLPSLFHVTAEYKFGKGNFGEAYDLMMKSAAALGEAPNIWLKLFNFLIYQILASSQGKLSEVSALFDSAMEMVHDSPARYSRPAVAVFLLHAEVLYEKNELARAENLLLPYISLLSNSLPDFIILTFKILAAIRAAYGDSTGEARYIAQMERLGAEKNFPRISASARQQKIRTALKSGDITQALNIQKQYNDHLVWSYHQGRIKFGNEPETSEITLVRLLIAQGRSEKALYDLKEMLKKAEDIGLFRQALLIRVLMAEAYDSADEKRQAFRVLREALVLGQKEGFIRIFVDEGDPISKMIRDIYKAARSERLPGKDGISMQYLEKLMHAIGEGTLQQVSAAESDAPSPERLTGREIEILEHMAMGYSNEKLADQLCLSVHTVRFHLRNIYWKLGAHNRTQAVALARRFGFIK